MNLKSTLGVSVVALLSFLAAGCSSNSSSKKSAAPAAPVTGTYSVTTTGGLGGATGGSGGSGGNVDLYKASGTGNAEMLVGGNADASFTAITPATNLGTNPLSVTTNTTVAVAVVLVGVIQDPVPATGTPYLVVAGDNILRISDGNTTPSDETPVTGISVASGVTLTFALNASPVARIILQNDVANSGTITTADVNATNRGSLEISPDSYVGVAGSSITTAGTADGQNGGGVNISTRSLYNHGTITTRGSDSAAANGGSGGQVSLYANRSLQNTASISSRGGDAAAGIAGSGGSINLSGDNGFMHNSGSLSNFGGNGLSGGGSNGVSLNGGIGNLLNSGAIDSHGGNGSDGDGGNGGSTILEANGGELISNASITTTGGNTIGATFSGGNGDSVEFYTYDGGIEASTPIGGITVSGTIITSGGDAVATSTGSGGSGGAVYANMDADNNNQIPSTARLAFLGYGNINTSGGDGNAGGNAGNYQITNDYTRDNATNADIPSGDVTNEVNLLARGGNAVATATVAPANGGSGGNFYLQTDDRYGYNTPELEKVKNSGTADLNGGSNLKATSNNSGRSGSVWFFGYNGVSNTGAIIANGGSDADTDGGTTGYGGYASSIAMYAETGSVSNSAALTNNGGNGEYRGGYSDGIDLYGVMVSNTGNLTSNGGNALASLAASQGGNGGYIELFTPSGAAGITHSGSVSHTAGTGTVAANPGSFVSGGLCSGYC